MRDSREIILDRLKNNKTREEQYSSSSGFNFLKQYHTPLLQTFQEKLEFVKGEFVYCNSQEDFNIKLRDKILELKLEAISCIEDEIALLFSSSISYSKQLNKTTDCCITGCEVLIAQTGSAILSTTQTKSRKTFAYPPVHIIVAFKDQLVSQLEEGLKHVTEKYNNLPSQITTITGPSRTADIEKTLVLGAHGPKKLIIMYLDIENSNN